MTASHQKRETIARGARIVHLFAYHIGAEIHARNLHLSAELLETGERFEGPLVPAASAPTFASREPAVTKL